MISQAILQEESSNKQQSSRSTQCCSCTLLPMGTQVYVCTGLTLFFVFEDSSKDACRFIHNQVPSPTLMMILQAILQECYHHRPKNNRRLVTHSAALLRPYPCMSITDHAACHLQDSCALSSGDPPLCKHGPCHDDTPHVCTGRSVLCWEIPVKMLARPSTMKLISLLR